MGMQVSVGASPQRVRAQVKASDCVQHIRLRTRRIVFFRSDGRRMFLPAFEYRTVVEADDVFQH